ncbi:hypothetical protein ScPMuIL_001674 [Solemya velum]
MADSSREQVLADFQACTQIEDIETCITILDQHDWNLMKSVQSVMPHAEGGTIPSAEEAFISPSSPQEAAAGFYSEPLPQFHTNLADSFTTFDPGSASGPSTNTATQTAGLNSRLLKFFVEYRDRNIQIFVSDTETVGKIKEDLSKELGIPPDKQELRGWATRKVDDKKILRDLNLPRESTLFLLTPEVPNPTVVKAGCSSSRQCTEDNNYTLNITFIENSRYRQFELKFPGSKSIQDVKASVYTLTDVPVRHQIWSGWPASLKDDSVSLCDCGIGFPSHALELTRSNIATRKNEPEVQPIEVDSDDDDVPESFPIEEDLFTHEDTFNNCRKQGTLIPESVDDEMEALEHFTNEFGARYGECHPVFYVGSLNDAIRDALMVKARERKLLAVYLHHDSSILSNVFCSQILCSEGVVSFLSNNFLTWAWDMTHQTNSDRLITMANRHFGSVAADQIRSFKADQLPALLIISRSRGANQVVYVIQGHVTLDELMTRLIQSVEVFQDQQRAEISEEQEREARDQIRQEQDEAYLMSLAADRKKAEAQREEEKRKQDAMEQEMLRQNEEEQRRQEEDAVKQAIQESLAKVLPDEPPSNTDEKVSKLRIRSPEGETLIRRFYARELLKTLFNYLASKGFDIKTYKVLTTFPRRDISQLDPEASLLDLKIFPQETLILEERT